MTFPKGSSLIRPLVHDLNAYVPGEQPKIPGLIKLNTNENPYPPSPKVLAAIKEAVDDRLRLYPNPTSDALRVRLAKFHGCAADNIIVGNGSDELLALATRTFVEPGEAVQFFKPSYSLYPVLAAIHGAQSNAVALSSGFALPSTRDLEKNGAWNFAAPLTFVTTPNAPSGRGYSTDELEKLCVAQKGVVVLDEAYVDFAAENAMTLALKYPHVIVSRTFSKAYSLCFQRVGYFVGNAELIAAMQKLRDSYNVNGLGQIGALATLSDLPYYRRNFKRIVATRQRMSEALSALGFDVLPSAANFIFVRPPKFSAEAWLSKLREKRILVRWFGAPQTRDFLRITIGTDTQAAAMLKAARQIVKETN
jgi:histidinol-phosphate aminotransferase